MIGQPAHALLSLLGGGLAIALAYAIGYAALWAVGRTVHLLALLTALAVYAVGKLLDSRNSARHRTPRTFAIGAIR